MKQEWARVLGEQVRLALEFHALQERQTLWRQDFMQSASVFLTTGVQSVPMKDLYALEEKNPSPIELYMSENPVWRTDTLAFDIDDNTIELEIMGIALGTRSTKPGEVRINFKGPYGRTFPLFVITEEVAKDWGGNQMSEEQQEIADEILKTFELRGR